MVQSNSRVKKSQVIGEMASERYTLTRSLDEAQANLTLHKQKLSRNELMNINDIQAIGIRSIEAKIKSSLQELHNVDQQIIFSKNRLEDLSRQLDRQKELQQQGFVSLEAVEQKINELLQQKINLNSVERVRLQLIRDVAFQKDEIKLLSMRAQSQKSQLLREVDSNEQEFNEHSSKRVQLIAPIDGIVTQISASVGQTVRPDLPIMTIVPEGSAAEVLLLIPSRSIGFIRLGQKVSVRYQAYPYEHYGRHYGVVKEIARAALPPQEVVQHIPVNEPVYTVRVSLPSNYLEYQGKQLPITPGMIVEADVELDRLKIYQWLLEPLYRLGGRV
jgi:membrane fusion protein